jgi:hypothetical protein
MQDGVGKDVEPRDLPRVPDDTRYEAGPEDGKGKAEAGWLEAGAEDPAFFIKPADEN